MSIDAPLVDQIVIVGRAFTRDNDALAAQWDHELRNSHRLDPRDLTVQVKLTLKGCWHRKAIGGRETACGKTLGGYGSRDESYAGELCEEGCFSSHEVHELARLVATPDDRDRFSDSDSV